MNLLQKLSPVLIVLTIIGVGASGYFFYQYQKINEELGSIKNKPEEGRALIDDVSRLISLPAGEDPAIATVDGNKILYFTKAKKAIIYDPVGRKIVDVATFNINSTATTSATASIKIVLRNGTRTTGLTTKAEPDIKKSITNASIITKENAAVQTYEKTIIVILNDSAKDAATKLAKDLNITTSDLPSREAKPKEGDILVILGKDRI